MRNLHRATIAKMNTRARTPTSAVYLASLVREVRWLRAGIVATIATQLLVLAASVGAIWGGTTAGNMALAVVMYGFGSAGIISVGMAFRDIEEQLALLDSVNQHKKRLQRGDT